VSLRLGSWGKHIKQQQQKQQERNRKGVGERERKRLTRARTPPPVFVRIHSTHKHPHTNKTHQRHHHQQNTHKKGIYNCGQQIVREEGGRALWKGLTPFATHLTLKYALRMGSNSGECSVQSESERGSES
jgi:hypothetical protein